MTINAARADRSALAPAAPAALVAPQGAALDPARCCKTPTDAWPTYHGDYSGRRYSTLKQINADNVKNLQLAWVYRAEHVAGAARIVGGEGPDAPAGRGQRVRRADASSRRR